MRVIANTFPKSGTGLLRQMLVPFGPNRGHISQYYGSNGRESTFTFLFSCLYKMGEGFMTAHLHWKPRYQDIEAKWLFLYRDPRAVAVSHAHYVLGDPSHSLHTRYAGMVNGLEECIKASIEGIPGVLPDIGQRFLPYTPWLHMPGVMRVEYEWLVAQQRIAVCDIAKFLGEPGKVEEMLAAVEPEKSPTFRKGSVNGWRDEMSKENLELFDKTAGWLARMLRYGD